MSSPQIAVEQSPYGEGVLLYVKKPRTELNIKEFEDFSAQIMILRKKLGIKDEDEKRPIDDFFVRDW